MVYFKFPFSKELVEKIGKQSDVPYDRIYYPISGNEQFCYVQIPDEDFESFLKSFMGEFEVQDSWLLDEGSYEWPDHPINFSSSNRRGYNFHFYTPGDI